MPKKTTKEKAAEAPEIINWYTRMDKTLLVEAENPNFNLHKLKLPFRMCIVAPSGSGKTNFLVNLIHLFSKGKGTFSDITIITKNKDESLYKFLAGVSEQIQIKEGLHNTPALDKFSKDTNHLVCFDDLCLQKDQSMIEQYYIRARKLNCSVIYLSQSFFRIPKIIRTNCSYMVILKLSGNREVNLILSEFCLGVSKEQLLKLYEAATNEKFIPLLIDIEAEPADRFRRGFLQILTPPPE